MTRRAHEIAGSTSPLNFSVILVLLGSALLAGPGSTDASQCFYPYVPRPLDSSQEIRERLEADVV
jgi:hypothetical protein